MKTKSFFGACLANTIKGKYIRVVRDQDPGQFLGSGFSKVEPDPEYSIPEIPNKISGFEQKCKILSRKFKYYLKILK